MRGPLLVGVVFHPGATGGIVGLTVSSLFVVCGGLLFSDLFDAV